MAAVAAWFGLAREAHAHGPPLAVHDVLTWEAGAPGVVRLLRGAAVVEGDGLRFVCPTRWGGLDAPLMLGGGEAALVFAESGFAWLGRDGQVAGAEALAALTPSQVRAVAADGGQVVAVVGEGQGGALWRLAPGAPERLWGASVAPDAVAIGGASSWLVATEDGGRVVVSEVSRDVDGATREVVWVEAAYRATPALVWLGLGGLWLRGAETGGFRLDRVVPGPDGDGRLVNVARTSDPIFGPVAVTTERGSEVFVVIGGALRRVAGDELGEAVGEGVVQPRLFCLRGGASQGDLFACDATDLLRVDAATGALTPFLGLAQLLPPSLDGLDDTTRFACNLEWQDAARDAGLAAATAGPDAVTAPVGGAGGGCGTSAGVGAPAVLGLLGFLGRRRGRPGGRPT